MKELEKYFERSGFKHKLIERIGRLAIYERSKTVKDHTYKHFELILPLIKKEPYEVYGRVYEAGEYYPGGSLWGTYGWTFNTLELARAQADEVLKKLKLRD